MHYFLIVVSVLGFCVACVSEGALQERDFIFPIIPIMNENNIKKKTKIDVSTYENREWVLAVLGQTYRISFDRDMFLKNFFTHAAQVESKKDQYQKMTIMNLILDILSQDRVSSGDIIEIPKLFLHCFKKCLVVDTQDVEEVSEETKDRMYVVAMYSLLTTKTLDLAGVRFLNGILPKIMRLFVEHKRAMLHALLCKNDLGQYNDPYKRPNGAIKHLILRDCNITKLPQDFWDLFVSVVYLDLSHNQLSELPDFTNNFKTTFRVGSYIRCPFITIDLSNNTFKEFPLDFSGKYYFFPFLTWLNLANNDIAYLSIPYIRDPRMLSKTPFNLDIRNNSLIQHEKHFELLLQQTFPQFLALSLMQSGNDMVPSRCGNDMVPSRFGKVSTNQLSFVWFLLQVIMTKKGKHVASLDISGIEVGSELLEVIAQCAKKIGMIHFGKFTESAWEKWNNGLGKKITKYSTSISFSDIALIPDKNQAISTYFLHTIRINGPDDGALGNIQFMNMVYKIALSDIPVNTYFLKKMQWLPFLHEVALRRCNITDKLFQEVVRYLFKSPTDCRLQRLMITENPELTQVNIPFLPPSVFHLDISNNNIDTLSIKQWVKKMTVPGAYHNGSDHWMDWIILDTQSRVLHTSLQYLNLSGNNLSEFESIRKILKQFWNIKYITIAKNCFVLDPFLTGIKVKGRFFGKKRTYKTVLEEKEENVFSLWNGKMLTGENPFTQHTGVVYAVNQRL
jgi:Leucine-rich repeat (LRR) protein